MFKKSTVFLAALATTVASFSTVSEARDQVRVVGSSTVFPFSTTVAEQFGKTTKFKSPVVESTGSGGGLKLFCSGVGDNFPDVTNASRRIKKSEVKNCAKSGITDILEMKIGYDGIVLANSNASKVMTLSLRDIFLALAKDVPDANGTMVENPYKTWNDVNKELPKTKIEVLGPPPTSGTRDAFVELAMEGGCKTFPAIKKLKKSNKKAYKSLCHTIREDGAFIEAGENDNMIVQKLTANPKALGIFGFSFLDQNSDKVQGSLINGKEPSFENIADGAYPVSRPLYFYVKKDHMGMIPGLHEFVLEFSSDKAWGDEGYLTDKGLIPMPEAERKKWRSIAEKLMNLSM